MSYRLANTLLIVLAIIFVAVVIFGIWMAATAPSTIRQAECPPGYEFIPKQAFTSQAWCVNGGLAVTPIWTNVEVKR